MTAVQIVGAVLVALSLVGVVALVAGGAVWSLLALDEEQRTDLAQDASPCRQELRRYQR